MNLAIVLVSNSSFSLMTMKTKMLTVIIFDAKVHNLNSALHILSYFFSFESRIIPCILYVVRWVVGLIQVIMMIAMIILMISIIMILMIITFTIMIIPSLLYVVQR